MNISKMSDMKIIQGLKKIWKDWKNLKGFTNGLKKYYEICCLFEKEAFEEMICCVELFFIFWG